MGVLNISSNTDNKLIRNTVDINCFFNNMAIVNAGIVKE